MVRAAIRSALAADGVHAHYVLMRHSANCCWAAVNGGSWRSPCHVKSIDAYAKAASSRDMGRLFCKLSEEMCGKVDREIAKLLCQT